MTEPTKGISFKKILVITVVAASILIFWKMTIHRESAVFREPLILIADKGDRVQCTEKRHIVYVRMTKTGSTTLSSVISRFAVQRELKFLLPNPKVKRKSGLLEPGSFHLPSPGKFCDVMNNIMLYNYDNYRQYFPPDMTLITLLRDPLEHLASTIYYFDFIAERIPSQDKKLWYFLQNPQKYEVKFRRSMTHNPVTEMLGLSKNDMKNVTKIKEFISRMDQEFTLVLILEMFDESLLILRRILCWSYDSILYTRLNVNAKRKEKDTKLHERLRKWSTADFMLYDHFKNKLTKTIKESGSDFQEELYYFRNLTKIFWDFCQTQKNSNLAIQETRFHPSFEVSKNYCSQSNEHKKKNCSDE